MANPGELIRRAVQNKKRLHVKKQPADTSIEPVQQEIRMVRRPLGGHSAYSALMRSHDRVHPRIGR